MIKHRNYTIHILKLGTYGLDLSDVVTANHAGYDDDIDPFATLVEIDNTQQRAIVTATGFSSTYLQFGRMLITGTNYAE